MELLFKIAGIAVAGLTVIVLVKKSTPEIAIILSLFIAVAVFAVGFDSFRNVKEFLDAFIGRSGVSGETVVPIWKTCVIAIVTKITSDLCRDAHENAVASGVETAGAVLGLITVLPLFSSLFSLMDRLI